MYRQNMFLVCVSSMGSIKILPIFNQAERGVWTDCARIESDAMVKNYKTIVSAKEMGRTIHIYKQDWNDKGNNFTFAAYDNGQMVGFANKQGVFMANGYKKAGFLRNRLIAAYNAVQSR